MNYRISLLFLIASLSIQATAAQSVCDSTFSICDSITIDSIIFTNFPETGDRIHFYIHTNHTFLYAPTFTICPQNDSIEFVSDHNSFFSIMGPTTVPIFFEFIDFNLVGDTLQGYIIADNSSNPFPTCAILFKIAVQDVSTHIGNNIIQNNIQVFPNPANMHISVDLAGHTITGSGVQLFDLLGRKQPIDCTSNLINVSQVPAGLYVLHIEINNHTVVTKKILIR